MNHIVFSKILRKFSSLFLLELKYFWNCISDILLLNICFSTILIRDNRSWSISSICYILRHLETFVEFEKREKHPWRSVTCSTKTNTPPWVFFTFFKLYKWYQIAQRIIFSKLWSLFIKTTYSLIYVQLCIVSSKFWSRDNKDNTVWLISSE